jgi:hypothetical protein
MYILCFVKGRTTDAGPVEVNIHCAVPINNIFLKTVVLLNTIFFRDVIPELGEALL